MNLNEELKALLLSENEEDCRLAFEICKKKRVRVKELNELDYNQLRIKRGINYSKLPMYCVISSYLDWSDIHQKWYKWTKKQ